jgi:hypothetical protein
LQVRHAAKNTEITVDEEQEGKDDDDGGDDDDDDDVDDSAIDDDEEMAELQGPEDASGAENKPARSSARAVDMKRPAHLKQLLWKVRAAGAVLCGAVSSSSSPQPGSRCFISSS